MLYYPIFVNVSHLSCLIVGAGEVGRRKLATLLEAGPLRVVLLDSKPPDPLCAPLLEDKRVQYVQASFSPSHLTGHSMVFAATDKREVNAYIASACKEKGLWCNCTDAPFEGTFIVPATAHSGSLSISLSTGGQSPALARKLRQELEEWLEPRARLSILMGRLRPLVLALGLNTADNTRIFRALVMSDLQTFITQRDMAQCEACLKELIPAELHPHIVECIYDLV